MRRIQLPGLAALLGLTLTTALPLTSCSSGGDSASAGPMFIETCTLGCSNGQGGQQVSCTIVDVAQNVEITVLFSQPVDLSTVDSSSFRITNTLNGSSPVGTFVLDPTNKRRLIFRPALTFDAVGNPLYALDSNQTYEVLVPGTAQGDTGSIVRSQGGKLNETRLRCTINTTQGLLDPVPGPPTASTSVVVTEQPDGQVLEVFDPANGAVDVPVGGGMDGKLTRIVTTFDDIMNPATLANLSTGQSSTVTVAVDVDGDPVTTGDRVTLSGEFQVEVSFEQLRTLLSFTPTGGFPSGGQPGAPRLIVITLTAGARDLVSNPLSNPGESLFQTEIIDFAELVLPVANPDIPDDQPGEQFQDQSNLDAARSGAAWGDDRLTFGQGGGTGRAGALVIEPNGVVELNTDMQVFPHMQDADTQTGLTNFSQVYDLLDNAVPGVPPLGPGEYDPLMRSTWPTIVVEDGAFEFTQVEIKPGGTLRLRGENPGRVFSRGPMIINGRVDVSGAPAINLISNTGNTADGGLMTAEGGTGGAPGPNAGFGGDGADRFNHGDNPPECETVIPMQNAGGIVITPSPPNNPGSDNDGGPGQGVAGTALGGGQGGMHWPPNPPRSTISSSTVCFGDVEWVINQIMGGSECRVGMVAGPGSGGAYALDGGEGMPISPFDGAPTAPGKLQLTPGPTAGGDSSGLGLEPPGTVPAVARKLDNSTGHLRGGSGGGGGGMSVYGTRNNAGNPTVVTQCDNAGLFPYWDHRAAAGGGGGGAVQLVSGTRLTVGFNGIVDARGGKGGGSVSPNFPIANCSGMAIPTSCTDLAAPGGGGSGGAIRLQSLVIEVAAIAGKVNVTGGAGGTSSTGSIGGQGSPGLVRLERPDVTDVAAEAAAIAPSIGPYFPNDAEFNNPFTSAAILSIGRWEFQRDRPDSLNAAASCWMIPTGNFFDLEFSSDLPPDQNPTDDPEGKGWNMDVLYAGDTGLETYPYRGLPQSGGSPLGNVDFQTFLQNLINSEEAPGEGSLIAVRFQGARVQGNIEDPCNVPLSGIGSKIQPDSLTRWVMHPDELNLFNPRPDMVRFCVVFEENLKSRCSASGLLLR